MRNKQYYTEQERRKTFRKKQMKQKVQQLLATLTTLIETQEHQAALELLTAQISTLQTHADKSALLTLLEEFPITLPLEILYLQGKLLLANGRYPEASHILNRAKLTALQQKQYNPAINCCLELAYLYQRQENFQTALYYIQEAENIAQNITNQEAKAYLWLTLAELCPDIGQLEKSLQYARSALHNFSLAGDCEGQFKALYLLAIVNRQLGQYNEAASRLEMARQCQRAGELSNTHYAQVISAEAHLLWYQGRLRDAISKAHIYRRIADLNSFHKQRVYAHILLGNLYRAEENYEEAERWYAETEQLITQCDLPLYFPWVHIQKGWLKVLTGDLVSARRYIHLALQTDNRGLQMSFNVNLACLELLSGHYQSAHDLLQASREFYAHSGDTLSHHVIGLYLAYLHHQQEQTDEAVAYLQPALAWFHDHNITYFPNWWHPQMMAVICVLALDQKIATPLAERIMITHLHEYEVLRALQPYADTAVYQHARHLHRTPHENDTDLLSKITDPSIKISLQELLQNGPLCPDTFPQLLQKLSTAKHRHKINPTCVAVFGLYLAGSTRQQIANKLNCSPTTVRNYITTIYQVFHVADEGKGTLARKEALRQIAQAEGFILE